MTSLGWSRNNDCSRGCGVTRGNKEMAMKRILVCTLLALGTAAFAGAATQDPALVAGRVTDPPGAPVAAGLARITELPVGTSPRADGRYRLVVPALRLRRAAGQRYQVMAS